MRRADGRRQRVATRQALAWGLLPYPVRRGLLEVLQAPQVPEHASQAWPDLPANLRLALLLHGELLFPFGTESAAAAAAAPYVPLSTSTPIGSDL